MFVYVVVYTPNGRIFYLNITINNIVKVFRFDISPPSDDLLRASLPVIRLNLDIGKVVFILGKQLIFILDKSVNVYNNYIVVDF